jgi:hypothetical protein
MEAALCGDWREEHLFVLRQSLENYRHVLSQMAVCDGELEKTLAKVVVNPATVVEAERPKNPPAAEAQSKRKKKFKKLKAGTGLKRDMASELTRVCGVDLTRIIGLNVLGVLILISEIGVDMSRWRNAKAFCAWLGLCPGNKISGGKVLSSHTVHVVNRVAILLRTVAPAVGQSDTWLGIFHRRMRARLGPAAEVNHNSENPTYHSKTMNRGLSRTGGPCCSPVVGSTPADRAASELNPAPRI